MYCQYWLTPHYFNLLKTRVVDTEQTINLSPRLSTPGYKLLDYILEFPLSYKINN